MGTNEPGQENNDVELVRECLAGSPDAFGRLMDRYQDGIYNLCFRMLSNREDAADLTQETFLKFYRSLYLFQPQRKLSNWLYTIGLNLCRDRLRKRKILRFFSLHKPGSGDEKEMEFQVVDPRPPADEEVSAIQQTKIIEKIISELPEKQRAVMALYYTHRMSPVEIAQTLDISLNNLRVQLHKARCRMFEEYKKMTEEN